MFKLGENFDRQSQNASFHFIVSLDFPGMCFASTRCATVEPGKSWDLTPFCGRSTCVSSNDASGR